MSIYSAGQCTDGAANEAPWVERFGNLGNAKDWAANWARNGGTVTRTPEVGAVACFQPFCDGALAPYGHVGVVTAVNGGTFQISEMNGPAGPGHYDTRWCVASSGVAFLLDQAGAIGSPVPEYHEAFSVRVMPEATDGVNVREMPTTDSPSLRLVHPGQAFNCVAWTRGPVETDLETHGPDNRWYELAGGGWVASALVDGNAPNSTPQ